MKSGQLWMSRAVRWQYESGCGTGVPPVGCAVVNCEAYAAMEYRYQSGRGRYMVRPLDVNTFDPLPGAQWRDYRWVESPSGTPTTRQQTRQVNGVNEYTAINPDGTPPSESC